MRRIARYVLCASFCAPGWLGAQGFAVNELGTCAMGRAGTAAAGPCDDASAVWANPAGLARLAGTHASVSVTLIRPYGGFTDDLYAQKTAMPGQTYPVPSLYVSHHTGKLGLGLGVFAPYGLGTRWQTDFIGRFDAYNTQLKSIYVQPTVGYQVNTWLSLGLGIAYIHSTVELQQRIDLSLLPLPTNPFLPAGTTFSAIGIPHFTDFADATLKASGNGFAFNGGILIKASDRLTLGGHFVTRKTIAYTGDARFAPVATGLVFAPGTTPLNPTTPLPIDAALASQFVTGGPLVNQAVATRITLPDQGTVGFAYTLQDRWTLMAEYQQIVWGWVGTLVIDFANAGTPDRALVQDFRDSHAFRAGLEYQRSAKTAIRAGYLFHTAAAPVQTVTPLLPEGARNELTLGFSTELARGIRIDGAYQFIVQQDRRGRAGTRYNNGLYSFGAHLIGAGLAYTF